MKTIHDSHKHYLECNCSATEHMIRLAHWSDDKDIYIDVALNHYFGFWKRLWYGIKYIKGDKSRYGYFSETVADVATLKTIIEAIEKEKTIGSN